MSTAIQEQPSGTETVLRQVARRLQLAAFGSRLSTVMLIVGGVYGAVLLFSRSTGLPEGLVFRPISLIAIPSLALAICAVWHPRSSSIDAARQIDNAHGTKDLFLTYASLDKSAGDYQSLVAADAQAKAQDVDPQQVVTWQWQSRVGPLLAMGCLLWLAVAFLPQFDPFGKIAQAEEEQQKLAQLEKDKQATKLRKADLKKQQEDADESAKVDKAIKDLTNTFGEMKRDQPEANRQKLTEQQKGIGEKFRKLGAEKLKTLLSQDGLFQDFGGERQRKLRKWTDELLDGSSNEINQELQSMKDQLAELANEKDPVKRAQMAKELKEQLRDLAEFAQENAGSPELSAALRRAMRQMEQVADGENPQTAQEAMEALAESLDLSKMELQQLAEAARDMKRLEKALETLQQAKALNQQGELDGEGTGEFQSLEDYAELYAEMMGQDQQGQGTGGEGQGEGGQVPEDDSVASDFKKEQEKTASRPGKVLLSLKGKGMSESGEAQKEYAQAVQEIKQGISEAIEQEQVPPGYHEGIRGYFNSIDETATGNE